jgi:hypothetical protein
MKTAQPFRRRDRKRARRRAAAKTSAPSQSSAALIAKAAKPGNNRWLSRKVMKSGPAGAQVQCSPRGSTDSLISVQRAIP